MYQLGICDEAEADMYYMILLIVWFSIMPSIAFKRNALRQIKELGSNLPRYPKRYIAPANWMRKWFKITKGKLIPRFLYFELILSVAYAVLGPIFIVIYTIAMFGCLGACNNLRIAKEYDPSSHCKAHKEVNDLGYSTWGIYTHYQIHAKALAVSIGVTTPPEVHTSGKYGYYNDKAHSLHIWFGGILNY